MVPDSLPPASQTARANGAPPPALDAAQLAYIVQMQTYMGQRLAALEQLLTHLALNQTNGQQQVMVKDVSMSFVAMVVFMVKWALAAAPALGILIVFVWILAIMFGSLGFLLR